MQESRRVRRLKVSTLCVSVQVLEACRQVVQEMDAAKAVGEKGRLFQAIKAGVAWLSSNASNPDVSDSSRQVGSPQSLSQGVFNHLLHHFILYFLVLLLCKQVNFDSAKQAIKAKALAPKMLLILNF